MLTNRSCRGWLIVIALIVGVGLCGLALRRGADGQESAPAAVDRNGVEKANSLSRAFRAAARRVIPTVVKIKTTTRPVQTRGRRAPEANPFRGTPFEDFFDEDSPGFRLPFPQRGLGSGVIIDPRGIILTNSHVVSGADEVLVELSDGRQLKATDIKTDEQTDLAVLRIVADETFPAAEMGDSDAMDIGDWVIAVGNPFDLELTVSAGIISGKGRSIQAGKRTNFLQTDAAINPGNSGGPLVNLDGQVIGINTAIASSTGGYQGVGFAIPINLAKWVTGQLIKTGAVQRAYLGVQIGELSEPVARALGIEGRQGVVVAEVLAGSPAAEAGFREGDVILAFAGNAVDNPRALQELVERSPIDSRQSVEILRDRKKQTLTVAVKALPKDFADESPKGLDRPRDGQSPGFVSKELGLEISDLTRSLAERLGYAGSSGALVTAVDPDGLAASVGIEEGMLILRVGKKPVTSAKEFQTALEGESLEKGILMLVRTPRGNRFVVLQKS